ncbi:MAG: hypothetical protein IV086_01125 [Hyphomonadaceae bacterium]|nr:MAG: signal transduction protein with EFhand domain [Caulobacteraceae bacterium]MBT9444279.1 hypothetical protein [Hyphomonadaceae bacterium]TPW03985.1 MAG: signal transduction protein with EFhand domain [Alphaproteobacteria bacterium]
MTKPPARFLTTSLALAAALSLAACASGPPRGGPRGGPGGGDLGSAYRQSAFLSGAALLFVQFDADGDYATSKAEAEAGAQREWARASGGSTVLSPIQFDLWSAKALGGPNLGPYRLAFDSNVNNEITATEFAGAIVAKFDFWDKNKDGSLTRLEMVERLPDVRRGPEQDGARPADGPPGRGRPPRI